MTAEIANSCKMCSTPLCSSQMAGSLMVCTHCGFVQSVENQRAYWKIAVGLGVVLVASLVGWTTLSQTSVLSPTVDNMTSEAEIRKYGASCEARGDNECMITVFRRLSELSPKDLGLKANYAFRLTTAKRYADAEPIYQSILNQGYGTYDLMAYYATNLEGLNKNKEAIKWYEKSLALSPNLVDVAHSLGLLYAQDGRPEEAISFLQSFVQNSPQAQGALSGDISAMLELADKKPAAQESIVLRALQGQHFSMPLRLKPEAQSQVFLVDTGASAVTVPTQDIEKNYPELLAKATPVRVRFANGASSTAHVVKVPKMSLMGWEFKDVEVTYCDNCERLAGMSLLKRMRLSTSSENDMAVLRLRR